MAMYRTMYGKWKRISWKFIIESVNAGGIVFIGTYGKV